MRFADGISWKVAGVALSLIGLCTDADWMAAHAQVSSSSSTKNAVASSIPLPPEYRDWRLISVAHEEGSLNDLRAVLGNDLAIKAYRSATLPFPDGTIITRLAWKYTPSEENNQAFGKQQSFVAGEPTNVQLMIKDSRKFAATGGWGYAQFTGGKPDTIDQHTCSSCHAPAKATDFVFTRYAR